MTVPGRRGPGGADRRPGIGRKRGVKRATDRSAVIREAHDLFTALDGADSPDAQGE
ncbi:hypothetical protein T261_1137 [Streptomyces lydicus]|nr:hypothetical protein T261_1137 [Streptomyces lydicus]